MPIGARLLLLLLLACSAELSAEQVKSCLQSSLRNTACPHQIYRAVQLPDVNKMAVRCICVTDFSPLLAPATTPEARLAQLRLKQQLQSNLPIEVEAILQVLRRER
ncbi:hypothetical protein JAO78_015570 [Alishewanella sp. 16-MA]|uniref:Secreted protein n=1 Tax=Alishewanella maricola TaxID=2795740 RepID=A0ABS8C7C5_9ALTE|nr:hypothetical protein [Alishewanella maricola]MCB5228229.1 hypothetical protein [Alishewanella maricola]